MYTYSQSRLRDTIGKVKTKIVNMFYKKRKRSVDGVGGKKENGI